MKRPVKIDTHHWDSFHVVRLARLEQPRGMRVNDFVIRTYVGVVRLLGTNKRVVFQRIVSLGLIHVSIAG